MLHSSRYRVAMARGAAAIVVTISAIGCATRAPYQPLNVVWNEPSTANAAADPTARAEGPSLAQVAIHYERGCTCGKRLSNNCAHYLSNAFIDAGYAELAEDPAFGPRCQAGRPIRAQDMLKWFQERSVRFHQGIPPANTGLWAGYQEKPGRRHVLILDTDTGQYFGTDHCADWPVQWFYQWP